MAEGPPVLPVPEMKKERYDEIKKKFVEKFGEDPAFFARAPGRVNLIGEHIDYCGYSVLPMAVEQDIVMAVKPDSSGKLTLVNTDGTFEEYEGNVMNIHITKDVPHWYKYVLCGVLGIKEQFCSLVTQGFKAMVDGTVPKSAGLSSSSALVCCSALAMLRANQWPMSKEQIAETCAKCEHYIGTEGGGMDQAISITARLGKAKLIEFNPLRTTDVQLPGNASFVVSNSLAEMNKAATPHFNIRVVECRLAAQVLAQSQGSVKWREIKRLGELQEKLGLSLEDMLSLVATKLHTEPYSKEEVCSILGTTPEELAETSLSSNTLHVESFRLYQRATHVYSEAKRVLRFKVVCDEQPEDALEQLGQLMNESHASCRDMYECSHPELDKVVDVCRQAGAVGSRMTGAGWGGCAVSLVRCDAVKPMLAQVKDNYYKLEPKKMERVKEALFATTPGDGAAFYI
ncbi:N-acetylgalactosamine kinase [Aplysia californica]|uniref:N-acetylgalactosamine kinase n=1 Tax=Aplysia californica TaxID=6500 RepID=A0ABM1VZP0_APLCA|nr:N-acetylgalactosamine kinase [Aplysia californica]XP_035827883.1 N-acetylgalactosamine kinase [Aplysia californica]